LELNKGNQCEDLKLPDIVAELKSNSEMVLLIQSVISRHDSSLLQLKNEFREKIKKLENENISIFSLIKLLEEKIKNFKNIFNNFDMANFKKYENELFSILKQKLKKFVNSQD